VVGNTVSIKVTDSVTDNALSGVTVLGDSVSGTTDASGMYSFTLAKAGAVNLKLSKSGYSDKSISIISLCRLDLQLSSTRAKIDDTVTAIVYNEESDKVSGTLTVTDPDGGQTTTTGDTHKIKPELAGTYILKVSKPDCVDKEVTLSVTARSVTLSAELEGDEILVVLESESGGVANVELKVTLPDGSETTVVTNNRGEATIQAEEGGDYIIALDSAAYGSQEVTVTKGMFDLVKYWWVLLILFLIILVIIIAVAAGIYMKKKPKESFKKKPARTTRLGG
jgi:hypothetical protein